MSISKEHGFQLLKKVIAPSTGEITVTEEIAISHLVVDTPPLWTCAGLKRAKSCVV